jgi:hypothetical protein
LSCLRKYKSGSFAVLLSFLSFDLWHLRRCGEIISKLVDTDGVLCSPALAVALGAFGRRNDDWIGTGGLTAVVTDGRGNQIL